MSASPGGGGFPPRQRGGGGPPRPPAGPPSRAQELPRYNAESLFFSPHSAQRRHHVAPPSSARPTRTTLVIDRMSPYATVETSRALIAELLAKALHLTEAQSQWEGDSIPNVVVRAEARTHRGDDKHFASAQGGAHATAAVASSDRVSQVYLLFCDPQAAFDVVAYFQKPMNECYVNATTDRSGCITLKPVFGGDARLVASGKGSQSPVNSLLRVAYADHPMQHAPPGGRPKPATAATGVTSEANEVTSVNDGRSDMARNDDDNDTGRAASSCAAVASASTSQRRESEQINDDDAAERSNAAARRRRVAEGRRHGHGGAIVYSFEDPVVLADDVDDNEPRRGRPHDEELDDRGMAPQRTFSAANHPPNRMRALHRGLPVGSTTLAVGAAAAPRDDDSAARVMTSDEEE